MAPAADELYARYEGAQDRFYEQPLEAQTFERMRVYEERMMHDLLDFVYDNRDAFVLVFARSAGTAWERYLDRFIELEVRSTARYVREMREHGIGVVEPTPEMSRILATADARSRNGTRVRNGTCSRNGARARSPFLPL